MFKKSLKHRKPIVYISLGIYSLLSLLIIVEAFLQGGASGAQSRFIANVSAWFVNTFSPSVVSDVIKPTELKLVTDSSFLGKDEEGTPKIAIGTTTLLSFEVSYPEKKNKDDIYDKTYAINQIEGNENDYSLVLSSHTSNNHYYIDIRIVANEMNSPIYKIEINAGESYTFPYQFKIVEKEEPKNYECKIDKNNIKINEVIDIKTKLVDINKDDYYLRRYFDINRLERYSSNPSIATIDKNGKIHGVNQGICDIHFGKYIFPIEVDDESIILPVDKSFQLHIKNTHTPNLLDYDYVFEKGEDPNNYSSLIYPIFNDPSIIYKSMSFDIDDELKGMIAPYKYDEEGYPSYIDEDNNPCIRLCGYRKKGDIKLNATYDYDSSFSQEQYIKVDEAKANDMSINVNNILMINVNEQKIITPTFNPKNVSNKSINVEIDNPELIKINNNDSASVSITALKAGKGHIKVTSLSNNELIKEFDIEIKVKEAINDDNYSDFHSFIRKFSGHFFLFLITSIFGFIFFYTYFDDKRMMFFALLFSSILGLFIASLSEVIQVFIPTRSGSFIDIGIDFLGYLIGSLITLGIIALINHIKKKKQLKNEQNMDK